MNIFTNYYWVELLLGVIAIIAFAYGEYKDRIEAGRYQTDCKIYRRRTRNRLIRNKKYNKADMGYNE